MGSVPRSSKDERVGKKGNELKREKEVRLIKIAIAVTSVYMLVELVAGYSFSALVLVADAYHMLNDLVAFIIQLYADEIGGLKREGSSEYSGFTYGFSRVAFVANLINGVILVALCLTLGLESLQRLYSLETMALPPLVAGLGLLALLWNWTMYRMFNEAHSHGEHSFCHPRSFRKRVIQAGIAMRHDLATRTTRVERELPHSASRRATTVDDSFLAHSNVKDHKSSLAIHAITDAAGNLAVIADGVVSIMFGPKIKYVSGLVKPWRGIGFIDPLASLIVTYVILMHSFPLVTASSYALMQAFDPLRTKRFREIFRSRDWLPHAVSERLQVKLLELRIWSLAKEEHIATLKFEVHPVKSRSRSTASLEDIATIEEAAKQVMGKANIRKEMITIEITTLPSLLTHSSFSQSSFAPSNRSSNSRISSAGSS